jgi:hypothetical protein
MLKYLRRTKNMFMVYGGENVPNVRGYTDASLKSIKVTLIPNQTDTCLCLLCACKFSWIKYVYFSLEICCSRMQIFKHHSFSKHVTKLVCAKKHICTQKIKNYICNNS